LYRYFTHYWKNSTWKQEIERTESSTRRRLLNHVADTRFAEKGIGPRDLVYPVTVIDGVMHVMCKLEVAKVCDFDEAASDLGTTDLWDGYSDHIIAVQPVPKHFNLAVPLETTRQLLFLSGDTTVQLEFESSTKLDRQTLRGVRELHPDSAMDLDQLLLSAQLRLWRSNPAWGS
jgi:hypothetical protein